MSAATGSAAATRTAAEWVRITLRGGVAVERVAHLDPLELLGPVALSPRAWPAFARVQAAGLRERIDR